MRIYNEEERLYKEPVIMIKNGIGEADNGKVLCNTEAIILPLNNIKIVATNLENNEVLKIIFYDLQNTKYVEHFFFPPGIKNKKLFEELKNTFNSIVSLTFSEYSQAYSKYYFSDIIKIKLFIYYTIKLQEMRHFISTDYSDSSFLYVGNTDPTELLGDFYSIINRDFILELEKQDDNNYKVMLETHYNSYQNTLNIENEEHKNFVEIYEIWDYFRKDLIETLKKLFDSEILT